MDNSCKRRAKVSTLFLHTERGQWQASFIGGSRHALWRLK